MFLSVEFFKRKANKIKSIWKKKLLQQFPAINKDIFAEGKSTKAISFNGIEHWRSVYQYTTVSQAQAAAAA